jgi:hypothetical protein
MAVRNDFLPGEILASQDLNDTFASKLDLAGGKILQIVRATDSVDRSTTSSSYVDAGLSVTITPQKSDSAILLLISHNVFVASSAVYGQYQITDSSNNAISGAEGTFFGVTATSLQAHLFMIGRSTPATTSAITYKERFRTNTAGQAISIPAVGVVTPQLYAIEVSA